MTELQGWVLLYTSDCYQKLMGTIRETRNTVSPKILNIPVVHSMFGKKALSFAGSSIW